jgi:hypothetical protein
LVFNLRKPQKSTFSVGGAPFFAGYPGENFQVNAYLNITPPNLELDSSFQVQIDRLEFIIKPDEEFLPPNRICVFYILFYHPEPDLILEQALRSSRELYWRDGICTDIDPGGWNSDPRYIILDLTDKVPIKKISLPQHNRFIYPYDDFAVQPYLEVRGHFYNDDYPVTEEFGDSFLSNPFINITIENANDWLINQESSAEVYWNLGYEDSRQVNSRTAPIIWFRRAILTKLISPLLCMVLLVFLILVAINEKKDMLIEGGLGIFLGVFSIREILLPGNAEIFTLVDAILWGIIFTFGLILVDSLIFNLRDKRSS